MRDCEERWVKCENNEEIVIFPHPLIPTMFSDSEVSHKHSFTHNMKADHNYCAVKYITINTSRPSAQERRAGTHCSRMRRTFPTFREFRIMLGFLRVFDVIINCILLGTSRYMVSCKYSTGRGEAARRNLKCAHLTFMNDLPFNNPADRLSGENYLQV